MKGFYIQIKNDLLDKKHVESMGQAIWLYMWLIDKMTSVKEGEIGIVLGGRPIKFEEIKEDLGIGKNTLTRWTKILLKYPYISTTIAPYGTVYKVLKAKKRFPKKDKRFPINEERRGSPQIGNVNKDNTATNTKDRGFNFKSKTTDVEKYFMPGVGWVKSQTKFK